MNEKNVWLLPTEKQPIKGDLILRHIWKGTPNECRSLWLFNEDIVIDGTRQYTTLNGSFRDVYTSFKPQNLYITNNEEIKQSDWFITKNSRERIKCNTGLFLNDDDKTIILTTDQDLIKEGIQEIPTDFLEWFVKNPSCEYVEIENKLLYEIEHYCDDGLNVGYNNNSSNFYSYKETSIKNWQKIKDDTFYKIITPQDQPKQTIEQSLEFGYEKKYTAKDMTDYSTYILNNKVITPFEWYKNNRK